MSKKDTKEMKTITKILPILRKLVAQGIYVNEEEAVAEFKIIRERL